MNTQMQQAPLPQATGMPPADAPEVNDATMSQHQGGLARTMANSSATSVEEVVQRLMQGEDPEQLLKQGIPLEVIKQAVELILAQNKGQPQQGEASAPATPAGQAMQGQGLAASMAGQ